jgi:5'-methylthioadenosine/S-adenosylhomocysteine nucleosidase
MTKLIAIIGAMDEEIEVFKSHLELIGEEQWHEFIFYRGKLWGKEVVLVKSGVGKVFAAMITQHLIDTYQPESVIFTGVAGGLNPAYKIGDVVVAKDTIQHDMDGGSYERGLIPRSSYREFVCDEDLVGKAMEAELEKGQLHLGRVLSGDQFISESHRPEFNYLREELAGDAVEMEGAAVGQVCVVNKLPFVVVRTISDQADGTAPQDFDKFLPKIVKNSVVVVKQIVK